MPDSKSTSSLVDALPHDRPESATEADDVERVRSLLSSADDPWHRSTPLHLTVSAAIVHPPTRRVLLRWHVRQQAWLLVGAHADPGETDPAAALRWLSIPEALATTTKPNIRETLTRVDRLLGD